MSENTPGRTKKARTPRWLGSQSDDDGGHGSQRYLLEPIEQEISPAENVGTTQTDVSRAPQRCWIRTAVPSEPPHRLVRLLPIGILVEVVIMGNILVTLASRQFSWVEYILGLIGVITPLALLTRGFWLGSQDEARARGAMRNGHDRER